MTEEQVINELIRQWGQHLADITQDAPLWFPPLVARMRNEGYTEEMIDLGLKIIDQFPPSGTDAECNEVIRARVAEEKLLSHSCLVKWLYADKRNLDELSRQIGFYLPLEQRPLNMTEALREAWAETLKMGIAVLEHEFKQHTDGPIFLLIADGENDEE